MKKYIYVSGALLVLAVILVVFLANRPPQLELETEEDSVPAFGETEETKSEETNDTEDKSESGEKGFAFTVSPANPYFGKELYSSALNSAKMSEDKMMHLPIFKMETVGELAAFQTSFGNSLSRGNDREEFLSFEAVTQKYDEAFFEKNTLLVVYVTPDSGSYRYGVKDILSDGESLLVAVEQTNKPTAVTMDLVGWLISVEMPKTATAEKNTFDATLTRPQ